MYEVFFAIFDSISIEYIGRIISVDFGSASVLLYAMLISIIGGSLKYCRTSEVHMMIVAEENTRVAIYEKILEQLHFHILNESLAIDFPSVFLVWMPSLFIDS